MEFAGGGIALIGLFLLTLTDSRSDCIMAYWTEEGANSLIQLASDDVTNKINNLFVGKQNNSYFACYSIQLDTPLGVPLRCPLCLQ